MADDYVRETLRTLRERTGDTYVPLSEVREALLSLRDDLAEQRLREIERRWGPGPQCRVCLGTGWEGDFDTPCACAVAGQ